MRVLFVGHDLTYAGFFAAIEDALAKHTAVQSRHVYFRPSAAMWARWGLGRSVVCPAWMRLASRWQTLGSRPGTRTATTEADLRFYQDESIAPDIATQLRLQALLSAYQAWLETALGDAPYDLAILPGEFRLFEQATRTVLTASAAPPRILFFEAGPPGYVYFDQDGVNAAASFTRSGRSALVMRVTTQPPSSSVPPARHTRSALPPAVVRKAMMALDLVWMALCKTTRGLLDLEEYWIAAKNRLSARRQDALPAAEPDQAPSLRKVVFIGQVHRDVNHTHFGLSDTELERQLTTLLADDQSVFLCWRDHPLERSQQLLQRLQATFPGRLARNQEASLQQLVLQCEGAVTVNSNGGLEALAAGIPVRLLGQSYYAGVKGVCHDSQAFLALRQRVRDGGPLPEVREDAQRFLRECFLPIDYRGSDFSRADLAAHLILASHESM